VELLEDTFFGLAVSPNGSQLALTCGDMFGGRIVLYDVQTRALDTLHSSIQDAFDVEFSRSNPNRLFYASRSSGIYGRDIANSVDSLVDTTTGRSFDLTSQDSVVVAVCLGSKPAVHPSDAFYAADSGRQSWRHGIFLVDMATGDTTRLDAMPYRRTGTGRKCWSPDGRRVVFTAMEWQGGDPLRPTGSEIWLLDSVTAR
jgi:Tol biopolymer transport system component